MSADPTAGHVDALAETMSPKPMSHYGYDTAASYRKRARKLLTSTDPAVHAALAASLPAEVMLAALVDRGTLTETWEAGFVDFRTRRDAEEFVASIMPGAPIYRSLVTRSQQVAP